MPSSRFRKREWSAVKSRSSVSLVWMTGWEMTVTLAGVVGIGVFFVGVAAAEVTARVLIPQEGVGLHAGM